MSFWKDIEDGLDPKDALLNQMSEAEYEEHLGEVAKEAGEEHELRKEMRRSSFLNTGVEVSITISTNLPSEASEEDNEDIDRIDREYDKKKEELLFNIRVIPDEQDKGEEVYSYRIFGSPDREVEASDWDWAEEGEFDSPKAALEAAVKLLMEYTVLDDASSMTERRLQEDED